MCGLFNTRQVNKDSQIMLTVSQVTFGSDVKVTAYVRHFTLYDLPARGFVRPMCLCYITAAGDKVSWSKRLHDDPSFPFVKRRVPTS